MLNFDELKAVTVYRRDSCAWFKTKADDRFAFSNMAGGFPLYWPLQQLRENRWSASEQLYQFSKYGSDAECRPLSKPAADPNVRRRIRAHKDARGAKMTQKCAEKAGLVRKDWESQEVRIKSMLWVLELKLYWNPMPFGKVLADSGTLPIVEVSSKTDFWGASERPDGTLVGSNVLGKLLADLRSRMDAVKRKQFTFPDGFLLP